MYGLIKLNECEHAQECASNQGSVEVESVKTDAHIERDFIFVSEVWRAIPGYSGYEASNLGRVRHVRSHAPLAQRLDGGGYDNVRLRRDHERKQVTCRTHRVVWLAFVGPAPEGKVIDHINGRRADNRLSNLRILTHSENNNAGWRRRRAEGTIVPRVYKRPPVTAGKLSKRARLTVEQVRHIRNSVDSGRALAAQYGVSPATISHIRSGKNWKWLA